MQRVFLCKNMVKKYMKKRKGSIVDVLPPLMIILTSMIIIIGFLCLLKVISIKDNVRQVAREYILVMETTGYLSADKQVELKQKLDSMSVVDVDLSGTSTVNVGYGNPIYLSISCSIPGEEINTSGNDLFSFFLDNTSFPISIRLMSTAKN